MIKKAFLFFLSLLCFSFLSAQQLGKFDVVKGFENYPLGSVFNEADTSLKWADNGSPLEYKGRKEYSYLYKPAQINPIVIGGLAFKDIILVYDSKRLIRIKLLKVYTPELFPDYKKRSEKEFKKVLRYLQAEWLDPGKKITFIEFKEIVSEGRQWRLQNRVMNLAHYKDTGTKPLYSVDIRLSLQGFE